MSARFATIRKSDGLVNGVCVKSDGIPPVIRKGGDDYEVVEIGAQEECAQFMVRQGKGKNAKFVWPETHPITGQKNYR